MTYKDQLENRSFWPAWQAVPAGSDAERASSRSCVGMFEHVGTPNYARFFHKIRDLLSADGIALVHSIGRMNGPAVTSAWTRKYIFPGGHIPALSEVAPVIECAGLVLTDLEILRLHYAETLRHWRERFMKSHRQEGRTGDQRFCRMWEFYLASSELAFRYGGLMVFQTQLARQLDSVPLTRDYVYERESRIPTCGKSS